MRVKLKKHAIANLISKTTLISACCPCLTCILLVRTELLYHTVRSRTGQKHCVKQQ